MKPTRTITPAAIHKRLGQRLALRRVAGVSGFVMKASADALKNSSTRPRVLDRAVAAKRRDLRGREAEQLLQNLVGVLTECRRRAIVRDRGFREFYRIGDERRRFPAGRRMRQR